MGLCNSPLHKYTVVAKKQLPAIAHNITNGIQLVLSGITSTPKPIRDNMPTAAHRNNIFRMPLFYTTNTFVK